MIETTQLSPGITLRCYQDSRFKHGCLSVQFVRPMCREEAALNALLPAVLLRGSEQYPDLRAITLRLDDLYGAAVGTLARRVGDYQTTGLYCSFMEDRFALPGDQILKPLAALLEELLLRPALENGAFRRDYVESEKKNLISTIESERNDKRAYASAQLIRLMCREDSFGVPRLGEAEQVAAIDAAGLYAHYQKVLRESRVELFYVGSAEAKEMAALLQPIFEKIPREYAPLPDQTAFHNADESRRTEQMEVAQGRLAMGFVTPVTVRDNEFVPMQLMNVIFGSGMTSKLFMNVRERMSLCYDIGSGYHSAKGILTVYAGVDPAQAETAEREVMAQLAACQHGEITEEELAAAKAALLSGLRSVHDTPGAIENYYATSALSGLPLSPEEYRQAVEAATKAQIVEAARKVRLHTVYFLKGVSA